jgi:hypothetical protein
MKRYAFIAVLFAFCVPFHSVAQTHTGSDLLSQCEVIAEGNTDSSVVTEGLRNL